MTERAIDWFRIIADLQRAGFSLRDIHEHTDIPHPTLLAWGQGTEPRHSAGEKLLAFWAAATGNARDDAPLCDRLPTGAAGARA